MNCKQCQEKTLESLACIGEPLAIEVAAHQDSCCACQKFYELQRKLFQSIDAGIRALVNQPVPRSLLPGVRARLDEPMIGWGWLASWSSPGVAAVAILAVSLAYVVWRPESHRKFSGSASMTSLGAVDPLPAAQRPRAPADVLQSRRIKRSLPVHTAAPEVIVLAEERRAFAKFVAEIPQEPAVAVALTHPAVAVPDEPIEIALLRIDGLQVKPLEATAKE